MVTRYFALIFGIVYVLVGILGFIPALYTSPGAGAPHLVLSGGYGDLLGLFPVNWLHDLAHIIIGVAGIAAYTTWNRARNYGRALLVLYLVLAVFGLIPGLKTVFGLLPLYGDDVWLHVISALVGAYFGWFAPAPSAGERVRTAMT